VRIARPLPECRLCESPTRRSVWLENAGLCTECVDGIAATVRMVRLPPAPDDFGDATVFVERYVPPVPGQLPLPDVDNQQQ
jgi:hypothetical protein